MVKFLVSRHQKWKKNTKEKCATLKNGTFVAFSNTVLKSRVVLNNGTFVTLITEVKRELIKSSFWWFQAKVLYEGESKVVQYSKPQTSVGTSQTIQAYYINKKLESGSDDEWLGSSYWLLGSRHTIGASQKEKFFGQKRGIFKKCQRKNAIKSYFSKNLAIP